ncbi:MAG TPA: DUF5010 domain-containing protein, partial [Chthoniobacterales bacterium]|nr:DUF5010 domain-containing protein [Chthoniobacterales bacterium]
MHSPLRHRRLGVIALSSTLSKPSSVGRRRSWSTIVGMKARSLAICLLLLAAASIASLHAGAWYVGNTQNGEWVQYNKVWFAAGTYRFVARAGSPVSTAKIHLEVDGTTITSAVAVPNTGRVDKFGYVYLGSKTLTAGIHDLRVAFETTDVSLDWFMAVKDTDPTTSVKASDKTMVYPPATGMLLAPIIAFHASDSDGHAASLLDLGNPIKDANGNAFTDAQAQAWWSVPMYRDWDRRTDRYWDIIVDHLTALRAQVPYFYCKGTVDFTDGLQDREFQIGGGSFEGRWMQKFAEAVARNPQAASSLKIGMIWDQGGLGDDFAKVYGYNPGFATPALVDYAIQYYLGPWFDNIPASMLLQPVAGRPIIRMMSTSPSGVIKDGQISVFLQELRKRLQAKYGIDPLFIIQSDGTLDAATQAQVWGRVKGLNWSGPLATETRFNGSDWVGMSCGSRHGLDQVWLNDWNPVTNTGTPGGNSAGVDAFQSRLNAAGDSVLFNNLDRAQIGAYGAVGYDLVSGGPTKQTCDEGGLNLTNLTNGSYTSYNGAGGWDLTGVTGFKARVASAATGGNIEIRMDSPTGTLLGTCAVPVTGGAQTWTTQTCSLTGASGNHNIYLVYTGGAGSLFNFEWFAFTGGTTGTTVVEDEGLTNIAEGNAFIRSYHPGWQFPNQHMAAMRQYADPVTQTLMFEAEACDSYNKLTLAGNKGGTYRKQWYSATDLDVYRPLHNTQAWIAQNAGPGNLVSMAAGFFDVW